LWNDIPAGKLVLQFRKFQLIQLSLMLRLGYKAFKSIPKTASKAEQEAMRVERAAHRQALAWTLGHFLTITGLNGLPFMGVIALAFDMDDDPEDFDEWFTRAVVGGDKNMANLLLKGTPTLAGMDLVGLLGMQHITGVIPFTDVAPTQLDDKDKFNEAVVGMLGSSVATARTFAKGVGQIANGDVWRGTENMLPSGFRKLMQGYRYKTDGYLKANGDVLLKPDEISALASLWHGIGLRSNDIAKLQEAQGRAFNTEDFFRQAASNLYKRYSAAAKERDQAEMRELREEFEDLQKLRVARGLQRQPLSNLLKQPQEQAKRERNTIGGVQYTSGNREMVERLAP
jgi:hypothetical protein